MHNVIIIGSGPAGLTSAIYTARANLQPLLIEGSQAGGQLMLTTDVENYPGFAEGILGPDLMERMRVQALRFGTEILTDDVTKVDFSQRPFKVELLDKVYEGSTVIISTGASAKWIGIPSELKLIGHGVSSCATCDGAFFRNRRVMVVGGGDTAIEEATFLTRFASQVTVVHRRDQLRASKIMQERAFKSEKIDFAWDSVVEEVLDVDAGKVMGVRLRNVRTEALSERPVDGLFVAIGHSPNTSLFKGQIELDASGYIPTREGTRTNVPGVFAAGDVSDHVYRQAVTAAGMGCMAAIDAERFLEAEGA